MGIEHRTSFLAIPPIQVIEVSQSEVKLDSQILTVFQREGLFGGLGLLAGCDVMRAKMAAVGLHTS